MRAMILAAGLGTRLRPITDTLPKPMAPVLNRPLMEHTVRLLAGHGFREAIANLHWLPEVIEAHFADGSDFGIELSYSHEARLLGSAGGVRKVADFLGDSFLVVAGDGLTDIDLSAMREFHESHDGLATIATKRVAATEGLGVVVAGQDCRIERLQEKPDRTEALSDLANTSIYMIRAEVFDHFPAAATGRDVGPRSTSPECVEWPIDVFPALLAKDIPLYSFEIDSYWSDIGSPADLRRGNFDALRGAVAIKAGAPLVREGVRSLSPLGGAAVSAPAFIGAEVELGSGARIEGPAIIGDGCSIGAGAIIRDSVLLEGVEVPANGILIGALASGPVVSPDLAPSAHA